VLPTDISTLRDRLAELADVFDKKPLSDKALRVWFDTLREFPCDQVMALLIGWPKTHTKFPAPADVWKAMNEWSIDQRERKAALERREPAFHPGVGGAKAEQFIAKIRKTLNNPAFTPLEHWQRVHERQPEGSIGREYAEEVLRKKGVIKDREPGEDDEGKAVNF
jgi:hypothetical protein